MDKIIYLYPDNASFIRKDIEFLSKHYQVLTIELDWKKKGKLLISLFKEAIFLMMNIRRSVAVIIMFGGYWSFLPSLFGKIYNKPVYIILGGADCVSFPEYNYGSLRKPILRKIIGISYKLASRLLPVDESLVSNNYTYDPAAQNKSQGYLSYFPSLETPYTVIHNGFDPTIWNANRIVKDPNSFITIAKVDSTSRLAIKGIDLVIELAKKIPDHTFIIVGMSDDLANSLQPLPVNIRIHSFLKVDELKEKLSACRYYLQLSISEGFPNALCEAMLCECIPIGSSVGAMPTLLKDAGIMIERKDINEIIDKVLHLISLSASVKDKMGQMARSKISDQFNISMREEEMLKVIRNS